ncbi:MAG: tRNA uridine-5-carboxymethylaminomethyl(34) synthesis GTPase MnmE [Thermodesulfobacteriota bacterium]|nr:tRNA uridine-5-carboxymethylaminomethyl(34) synthesis GTPase MnmE [Thermodesulfobacteriota bacterium]
MREETIAAIATPPGSGGIGIIRISGSKALGVVSSLFGRTRKRPDENFVFESHIIRHGYIFELESGSVIDEVLIVPMLGKRSYTAEDVVEIQSHSGPFVMRTILNQVLLNGARLAEPGEFTKRAFLNGRIDLTQAEAVIDIINAKTVDSLKIAASQHTGALKDLINHARLMLVSFLAQIEAAIDFPDETDELLPVDKGITAVDEVLSICTRAIQLYDDAHFLRDGIKLVICGSPNVGKSSLMNRLLEKERAIVTSVPGTTRDLIEESLNINGIPFLISDTAGLHQTDDPVEKIGIERAKQHIKDSDLILFMEVAGSKNFEKEFTNIIPSEKKVILVFNKRDLAEDGYEPELPEKYNEIPCIAVSALHNQGIDNLRKMIAQVIVSNFTCDLQVTCDLEDTCGRQAMHDLQVKSPSSVVPNLRHKHALEQAVASLNAAKQGMETNIEVETLAIDIRDSADFLGQITGDSAGIDILDTIFKNFCLGK